MMLLSPSLRTYTKEDHARVVEIENSSFGDPWPPSFFTYIHGKAPDLFLLAEEQGRIVGYIMGEIKEVMFSGLSHRSKMGHILNIAVDGASRGRGVGSLLMGEIEEKFRRLGASHVTLEVRESNATARSFYLGRDYSEVGRVRAYYPDEDAVIMRKPLE